MWTHGSAMKVCCADHSGLLSPSDNRLFWLPQNIYVSPTWHTKHAKPSVVGSRHLPDPPSITWKRVTPALRCARAGVHVRAAAIHGLSISNNWGARRSRRPPVPGVIHFLRLPTAAAAVVNVPELLPAQLICFCSVQVFENVSKLSVGQDARQVEGECIGLDLCSLPSYGMSSTSLVRGALLKEQ